LLLPIWIVLSNYSDCELILTAVFEAQPLNIIYKNEEPMGNLAAITMVTDTPNFMDDIFF
jgi:hypothetical protein